MHITTSYFPDEWWVDNYKPGLDSETIQRKIGSRNEGISLVREGREIFFGKIPYFWINDTSGQGTSHWHQAQDRFTGFEIEFGRDADEIFIQTLHQEELYHEIWQAFAVLIPVKTVGVMGDQRTYEHLLGLRAVTSSDGMTADWFRMPDEALTKISNKIVNSVKGINRVVYDVTSKPPGTIEWE